MDFNQNILNEFRRIALFEALDELQLEKILTASQEISLLAKSALFEKGDPANYFYLLHSGQIKLYMLSAEGDEKVMEIIYPQHTFAEAVMFMPNQFYPVSAEAITDSKLYCFDMKLFRELLDNSKETCFRLLASMGKHLHARVNEINNLTLHNATYRLVVYLLGQLPDEATPLSAIHLTTPKSIIAARLSIKPETFSRILLTMSKQGLIAVHGNDISLLDVNGLRQLL
jgi:CRP-like cAMP-binding protein